MSTTYKSFFDDDVTTTKTLLFENIPITGSLISSSVYLSNNIKTYGHGMFQSVYDYPYQSASANQIFDLTIGQVSGSPGNFSSDTFLNKKINIYNQMAQVLNGYDPSGSILNFDRDGDQATGILDDKFNSMFFINFNRIIAKDEIKKGSFQLTLGINSSSAAPYNATCLISDVSGTTNYKVNSPSGEYSVLYATNFSSASSATQINKAVGLLYYQAGIAAISTNIFAQSGSNGVLTSISSSIQGQLTQGYNVNMSGTTTVYTNVEHLFKSGSINDACSALRNRIQNISFNNSTQLNSSIYFCRVNHNEFNYSSNPTYLTQSQIIVKDDNKSNPMTYITTVGLYSPDNELLAVAKLSEPIKKDPTQELILRVRLDY